MLTSNTGDRDFRDRRFRDFGGDSFDFGFYGFGYPDYYPYDYPYYYAYPSVVAALR